MWYPGQEGADATMALIVGDASPSGRLPVTFPRRVEDVPTNSPERYPGVDGHGRYSEGIYVGYRWYDQQGIAPLFPFGHGLSYTTFKYSKGKLDAARISANGAIKLWFTIKNTGKRDGDDVAQIYYRHVNSKVPQPKLSLCAFTRVSVERGKSTKVMIEIPAERLRYWDVEKKQYIVEPGKYELLIGRASDDIRLKLPLKVTSND